MRVFWIVAWCAVACVSGCTAGRGKKLYDGPRRGSGEVAQVRLEGFTGYGGAEPLSECRLVALNGQPVKDEPRDFEVLPGNIRIMVEWRWFGTPAGALGDWTGQQGRAEISFPARAGARYVIVWNIDEGPKPVSLRRVFD